MSPIRLRPRDVSLGDGGSDSGLDRNPRKGLQFWQGAIVLRFKPLSPGLWA